MHTLPAGIKRIQHYGVLGCACKTDQLAQARLALQMPVPNPSAAELAHAFMVRIKQGGNLRHADQHNKRSGECSDWAQCAGQGCALFGRYSLGTNGA